MGKPFYSMGVFQNGSYAYFAEIAKFLASIASDEPSARVFLGVFISDFVFSFSLLALFVHIARQKLSLGWSWPVWMPPCGHPMLPT